MHHGRQTGLYSAFVIAVLLQAGAARADATVPFYNVFPNQPLPEIGYSLAPGSAYSTTAEVIAYYGPSIGQFVLSATESTSIGGLFYEFTAPPIAVPGTYVFSAELADGTFQESDIVKYHPPSGTHTGVGLTTAGSTVVTLQLAPSGGATSKVEVSIDGGPASLPAEAPGPNGITLPLLAPGEHTVVLIQDGLPTEYDIFIQDVPEPASLMLLATGAIGIAGLARWRRVKFVHSLA